MGPRVNRIDWDDHHMLIALTTAQRSPDPNTQVGACIVNEKNQVLGVGYNSVPKNISPNIVPWARDGEPEHTKYPYVVHAEKNAIYNAGNITSLEGTVLYVTMFPCHECAKDIIQAGIKRIIYLTDPYAQTWQHRVSRWMLREAGIQFEAHEWSPSLKASGWHVSL